MNADNCGGFIQASGEKLPLRNNSIDVVVALGVFHHIPSYEDALEECSRVLRVKGFLLAREPCEKVFRYKRGSPHERGIPVSNFLRILKRSSMGITTLIGINSPLIKIPLLFFEQIGLLNVVRRSQSFWKIKLIVDAYICKILSGGYDYLLVAKKKGE